MKHLLVVAAAAAGGLVAEPLAAQTQRMRPGLWEHSVTMRTDSGQMEQAMRQMQQQMANLPPEQRKAMERMLASQGMGLGAAPSSVRVCISKEAAERDELPQQSADCRQQLVQRTGDTVKIKFACDGPPPSSGEAEVTFASPTAYTGKAVVDTLVQGKPERIRMEQSGKWLDADCGAIKPLKR